MTVVPKNRHLLVEVVENQPEKDSTILVPEGYSVSASKEYELAKIVSFSADCSRDCSYEAGQYALVEGHMIKSVRILDHTFQFVLENYVLATVTDADL